MKEQPGRKAGKLLDKTVFGFFNSFVDTDDEARVRGACSLIEFLCKDNVYKKNGKDVANDKAPKTAEQAYALKRLVRGVGSTSNASRAGFFTGLVGLLDHLKSKEDGCPTVTELFALVKSELSEFEHNSANGDCDNDKEKNSYELRVGKILVCGAIIKSGLIDKATDLELQTVIQTLKKGMHKMLTPLVYTFLNELAPQLNVNKFSKVFWPLFESVLNVPKEQHTIDSIYFLLLLSTGTHRKLVNKKYFERNFGAPKLLHQNVFPYISVVLFNINSSMDINHPFYDCLLEQLIKNDMLVPFVHGAIVPVLEREEENRPKYRDIIVLRMLISLLGRLENFTCLPEVLHPALMKFLLQNIKNQAQYSEDVRQMYQEAFKAVMSCYPKMKEEKDRLATFRCLTQAPSSILIEKYASCKLLQNLLATLSVESLTKIASELKGLILNESTGTNAERSYAAQMLQRLHSLRQLTTDPKDKHQADEQRLEVARFFLTLGVFYSSDGVKVLKSSKQDRAISQELATTLRGLFYHSLDHRHAQLTHQRDFLLAIVGHLNEQLQTDGGAKCLRNPLSDEQMSSWNRMYTSVSSGKGVKESKQQSTDRNSKKLNMVFHILLMHMGLHLFSDPELASNSLAELECVIKRISGKAKKPRQSTKGNKRATGGDEENGEEEPEWIEVVVDLFLNLLSQNSHLLRNVIGQVFPHLSGEMTLTAFNQILSVINLKDKTNPLTAGGESSDAVDGVVDGAESGEEESDDESDSEDHEAVDEKQTDDDDDENEDEDEDEEDDDEELMGDEEEEENISDKMRQAVQLALGGANPDTDTESIDLDEMDEEQGHQLDAALTEAFRAFQSAKSKPGKQKKGPTKAEQQIDTVLTHFRMRVFDLIDAYLKHEPDMILCLELMLYVFEMLPIAIREESKYGPIMNRYGHIFNTLIRIKEFRRNAEDVGAVQLSQILRDLIEKVAKGVAFPERNQYLLKACQFIVVCSQTLERRTVEGGKVDSTSSETLQVDNIFGDLLAEFLTNRNPPIAFNVFQSIFRMPWNGNWHLAVRAATDGLKVSSVRALRRIQAMQLLLQLLRNRRFVSSCQPLATQSLRTICTDAITRYVTELKAAVVSDDRSIGQNELHELLQLLLEIHIISSQPGASGGEEKKKQKQQNQLLRWEEIGPQLQAMRRFALNSQTMSSYRKLCNRLELTPIANGDYPELKENGVSSKIPDVPSNGVNGKQRKTKKSKQLLQDGSIQMNGHADKEHTGEGNDAEMVSVEEESEVQPSSKTNDVSRKRTKDQARQNGDGSKKTSSKEEKRRRKNARLQSASQGMEAISFANCI